MKKLFPILCVFLLAALPVRADIVRVLITITNTPVNGSTLVLNGSTKTWTNVPAASTSTLIQTTNSIGASATNLFLHLGLNPYSSGHYISRSNNNLVAILGNNNEAMSATASGWATVSYMTNLITNQLSGPLDLPIEKHASSNRVTWSGYVMDLFKFATNIIGTNVAPLANYADLTSRQAIKLKDLTNSTVSGSVITNSILTNSTLGRLNLLQPSVTTNAEGLIFYSGATPTTKISSYIGIPTIKGMGTNVYDISADPDDTYMLNYLSAKKLFPSMFLGRGVDSNYWQTVNTWTGESRFYTSLAATNVSLANVNGTNLTLNGVTTTNTITYGTNFHNGSTAYLPGTVATLVNGNNSGIELGTNTIVLLSGASTYCELAGFKIKEGGRVYRLRLEGASTNYIVNFTGSSRSTDAVSGQRIETGTGGDLTLTNNPAWFEVYYDTIHARWQVMSFSR